MGKLPKDHITISPQQVPNIYFSMGNKLYLLNGDGLFTAVSTHPLKISREAKVFRLAREGFVEDMH